jgi:acyl-CoA reductase-like NAD-dependent aldehyde dehydrogenase
MYTVHHHIAGHVQPSTSGRHADIFNPAIGRVQGQVDLGTAQELDQAVAAAQAAFTAWSAQPPLARARVMFRFLALLQQRQAQLAETIKTLPDAPAAGRGRWLTPFNFPAVVPLWMFPVALGQWVSNLRVGEGHQPDAEMGPVITGMAQQRIEGLIGQGIEEGPCPWSMAEVCACRGTKTASSWAAPCSTASRPR